MRKILYLAILISGCVQNTQEGKKNTNLSDDEKIKIKKNIEVDLIKSNTINSSWDNISSKYNPMYITSGNANNNFKEISCLNNSDNFYGFHSILDNNSENKPPIVAIVYVSYQPQKWDRNTPQRVNAILVKDELFLFGFGLIGRELEELKTVTELNNIDRNGVIIISFKGYPVALKLKEGIVEKYLIIQCENANIEEISLSTTSFLGW